jgi:predicted RNase H-like HicB family nuclease
MQVGDKNYEILIRRRGETGYAAFCPELELIVNGTAHEQVENKMKELILEHIAKEQAAKGGAKLETETKA